MMGKSDKTIPSYKQRWATYGESVSPDMWNNNVLTMATFLGVTGKTLLDHNKNKNDGAINGATWIPGPIGPVLSCNGSTNWIDCGNKKSLQITGDLTVIIRCRIREDQNENSGLFSKYGIAGNRSWVMNLFTQGANNRIAFLVSDDGTNLGRSDEAVASDYIDKKCHNFAGVFNSLKQTALLNIDGIDIGSPNGVGFSTLHNSSQHVEIAAFNNRDLPARFPAIDVEFVSMFNKALTSTELMVFNFIAMFERSAIPVSFTPVVEAGLSRYHDLNGLGGQGSMTWNPLG